MAGDPKKVVTEYDTPLDRNNRPIKADSTETPVAFDRTYIYADGSVEVWRRTAGDDPNAQGALVERGTDTEQTKAWREAQAGRAQTVNHNGVVYQYNPDADTWAPAQGIPPAQSQGSDPPAQRTITRNGQKVTQIFQNGQWVDDQSAPPVPPEAGGPPPQRTIERNGQKVVQVFQNGQWQDDPSAPPVSTADQGPPPQRTIQLQDGTKVTQIYQNGQWQDDPSAPAVTPEPKQRETYTATLPDGSQELRYRDDGSTVRRDEPGTRYENTDQGLVRIGPDGSPQVVEGFERLPDLPPINTSAAQIPVLRDDQIVWEANPNQITIPVALLHLRDSIKAELQADRVDEATARALLQGAANQLQQEQQAETARSNRMTEAQRAAEMEARQRGDDQTAAGQYRQQDITGQGQALDFVTRGAEQLQKNMWEGLKTTAPVGSSAHLAELRKGNLDAPAPAARQMPFNPGTLAQQAAYYTAMALKDVSPTAAAFLQQNPGAGYVPPPRVAPPQGFTAPAAAMAPPAQPLPPPPPVQPAPAPASGGASPTINISFTAPPAAPGPYQTSGAGALGRFGQ